MTFQLSKSQLAACDVLENNRFVLFTGPPGSGKTTSLAHWLHTQDTFSTGCLAPTGRASQRMEEAFLESGLRLGASTIHAGLIPDRNGHDGKGWGFQHNRENPLPYDRVIVDETSMVDTQLMAALLEAIAHGSQIILCGDPDQLAPVGKGKPFLDMIESKRVAHAELTEVFRYAGRLAHVCQAINRGERFEPSSQFNLDMDAGEFGPENLKHIERRQPHQALETLDDVIPRMIARGFDPLDDIQVIVSRNTAGGLNREMVNERLQQLLNPNGKTTDDCPFRVGDKVMCLRNGTRKTFIYDKEEAERTDGVYEPGETGTSVYTANGEGGVVEHVYKRAIYCRFGQSLISFPRGAWRSQVCLAYAITVHKSQGGGWPCVIFLIDDTRMCDRSLIYTAISRAKKACITIGRMEVLRRQIKKVSIQRRKTFLKEYLMGVL